MEAHHLDFTQSSDVGDVKSIGRFSTNTSSAWHCGGGGLGKYVETGKLALTRLIFSITVARMSLK